MRHSLSILGTLLLAVAPALTAQKLAGASSSAFAVDPSVDQVRPTLGEGDVAPLIMELRLKPRGEFESSADFSRRAAAALNGKTFAIAIRNGAGGDCAPRLTYDADSEQVTGYLTTSMPMAVDEKGDFGDLVDVTELRCTRARTGSFIGTNAFGVKTRVTKFAKTVVSIASDSSGDARFDRLIIPLRRAEASLLKPRLKIVAVFEPGTSPRGLTVTRGADATTATRDNPVEESSRHTIFWQRSLAFWVIDGNTGRVLSKQRVGRSASVIAARGVDQEQPQSPTPATSTEEPYFEFQVQKQATAVPGTASPRYPETLRAANVDGEVLAQFIVDDQGRYEPGSFKVIKSSHDLFTAAVRDALPNMKFYPAEIGGRKVRQLVQQPFTFGINR